MLSCLLPLIRLVELIRGIVITGIKLATARTEEEEEEEEWTTGMPNLNYITLSAYKSNTYMYLDVKSSNTQTADTCSLCMHTPTPTHKYTP